MCFQYYIFLFLPDFFGVKKLNSKQKKEKTYLIYLFKLGMISNQYLIKNHHCYYYSPIRNCQNNALRRSKSPIRQHYPETQRANNLSPIRRRNGAVNDNYFPKQESPILQRKSKKNQPTFLRKKSHHLKEKNNGKCVGLFEQLAHQKNLDSKKNVGDRLLIQTAANPQQVENLQVTNFSQLFSGQVHRPSQEPKIQNSNAFKKMLGNIRQIDSLRGSQSQKKINKNGNPVLNQKVKNNKQSEQKFIFGDSFSNTQVLEPISENNQINNAKVHEEVKDMQKKEDIKDSYQDITSLLEKISELTPSKRNDLEESVKVSFEIQNENNFNMNPFMT